MRRVWGNVLEQRTQTRRVGGAIDAKTAGSSAPRALNVVDVQPQSRRLYCPDRTIRPESSTTLMVDASTRAIVLAYPV